MGPLNAEMKERMQKYQGDLKDEVAWNTLGEYLSQLETKGVCTNVASLLGAATPRIYVIGHDNRPPTDEELARMQELVREAMREGAFLLDDRNRPFNAVQYRDWYGYREFAKGPHTNLMVHFIDLVHYVGELTAPKFAVAHGGIFRWKQEGYNVRDSVEVCYEYPEGFLMRYCTVFGNRAGNYAKWFGTRGTLDAKSPSRRVSWEMSGEGSEEANRLQQPVLFAPRETVSHMQNFLECVRSRQQPIAPIKAGYHHSVAVLMADEAMLQGRRMRYDADRRDIVPA